MGNYPLVAYHFNVQWGGTNIGFMEVSGLNIEYDVIEYREGASPEYHMTKMPGLQHLTNIVLKRGIFKGDNDFYNWINTVSQNQVERRDLTISLLDETLAPVRVWKVRNAWPVKLTGPTLDAKRSAVAIETLELAHEGITIDNS